MNGYSNTEINVGSNLYVQALNVPDFWVYERSETNTPYSYTTDQDLINSINQNGYVQIGYYKISKLETEKVDLTNYYDKLQIDSFVLGLSNRISAIENDETILKSTDTFILDGGNSTVGG